MTRLRSPAYIAALTGSLFAAQLCAQPAPAPGTPTSAGILRAVLASAALPSVVDAPRHFKLLRVSLPAKQSSTYNGAIGFIYVLSGTLEVTSGAEHQRLGKTDGLLSPPASAQR